MWHVLLLEIGLMRDGWEERRRPARGGGEAESRGMVLEEGATAAWVLVWHCRREVEGKTARARECMIAQERAREQESDGDGGWQGKAWQEGKGRWVGGTASLGRVRVGVIRRCMRREVRVVLTRRWDGGGQISMAEDPNICMCDGNTVSSAAPAAESGSGRARTRTPSRVHHEHDIASAQRRFKEREQRMPCLA